MNCNFTLFHQMCPLVMLKSITVLIEGDTNIEFSTTHD